MSVARVGRLLLGLLLIGWGGKLVWAAKPAVAAGGEESPTPAMNSSATPESEARDILAAAEELRNPGVSFAAEIALRSTREENGEFISTYAMKAGGRDRALIVGESPEHYRGRLLLRSGRQYYLHMRTIKNPLRVAPQQGFRGDVANADIARADYLADYEPALAGEEVVDGKKCQVLELTARSSDVAYRRLRYWIEKKTHRPVKTEHYAVSGRILKIVFYEDYREALGAVRPHRLRIVDGIDPTQITVIEYTGLHPATFPERIFNPSYLSRLEEMGLVGDSEPKDHSPSPARREGG